MSRQHKRQEVETKTQQVQNVEWDTIHHYVPTEDVLFADNPKDSIINEKGREHIQIKTRAMTEEKQLQPHVIQIDADIHTEGEKSFTDVKIGLEADKYTNTDVQKTGEIQVQSQDTVSENSEQKSRHKSQANHVLDNHQISSESKKTVMDEKDRERIQIETRAIAEQEQVETEPELDVGLAEGNGDKVTDVGLPQPDTDTDGLGEASSGESQEESPSQDMTALWQDGQQQSSDESSDDSQIIFESHKSVMDETDLISPVSKHTRAHNVKH